MSMQSTLYSTLQSLVSGNVYPLVVPENLARPYIVYTDIIALPENMVDGSTPPVVNGRYQISCWHDTYEDAQALGDSVATAMETLQATVQNCQLSRHSMIDPTTKTFCAIMDYSIWA